MWQIYIAMKKNLVFICLFAILPLLAIAQPRGQYGQGDKRMVSEPNVLSIFSDNGDYYYVVLNGVKQNINPQSTIRIEGIVQPVVDIQIMFADNVTRAIHKKTTISNPVDRQAVNLTLKIVREQDGDAKLRLYMCVPKEENYIPMQGEYVMVYGQDIDRTRQYNDHDRDRDRDHGHDRDHDWDRNKQKEVVVVNTPAPPPPPPPAPPAPKAMDNQTFASAIQAIRGSSFEDTKFSTASTIATNNFFNITQVKEICNQFSFEETKLKFAKLVFKRTVDNNNYFMVNDVFSFDASKNDLNNYVSQNR